MQYLVFEHSLKCKRWSESHEGSHLDCRGGTGLFTSSCFFLDTDIIQHWCNEWVSSLLQYISCAPYFTCGNIIIAYQPSQHTIIHHVNLIHLTWSFIMLILDYSNVNTLPILLPPNYSYSVVKVLCKCFRGQEHTAEKPEMVRAQSRQAVVSHSSVPVHRMT